MTSHINTAGSRSNSNASKVVSKPQIVSSNVIAATRLRVELFVWRLIKTRLMSCRNPIDRNVSILTLQVWIQWKDKTLMALITYLILGCTWLHTATQCSIFAHIWSILRSVAFRQMLPSNNSTPSRVAALGLLEQFEIATRLYSRWRE